MAMEHTALGSFEITAQLRIATGQTAANWKAWADNGGYFVKLNTATANIATGDDSLITVDPLADGDHDNIVGLLRSHDGPDTDLTGRILLVAADVEVEGGGTGAITTAQLADGVGIQGDADHKAEINTTAANAFGRVIGGTQARPRMSFISCLLRDNTTAS